MTPKDKDDIYQKRDILIAEIHSDLKYMRAWCDDHKSVDDMRHNENLFKFEKIDKNQVWCSRIIFGALGIVGFLQFVGWFK